ncbi:hypothetical protein VB711_22640 [Cronbergia sp. UHCC 0137]|uniref:hypothetical protein n=1 Tax=Cronbergia sp. UHCC 0137 TaxID=3110239 RepID=UPI002B21EB44|nr:hypothetical protein [Cronbergia sp. UHCC 0137]MEA5620616.1 hypothetical protein [Cronbergia sp. UHCC 0137]
MLNNIYKSNQFIFSRQLKLPLVGLLLTFGIVGFDFVREQNQVAQSLPLSTNQISNGAKLASSQAVSSQKSPVNSAQQDDIYLYGQSTQPNQLGQGYIVFQKHQGKVTGALYMPQSEFSCFQGTLGKSGELAMTVTSSPGELGVTKVSTASRIPKFDQNDSITYPYSVTLEDYHRLKSLSANDKQILQMCHQFAGDN